MSKYASFILFFRCVKSGDWLLIEDVHLAPSDVMSTLLPLIERRQLHVPSRGVVIDASPGWFEFEETIFEGGIRIVSSCHKRTTVTPIKFF